MRSFPETDIDPKMKMAAKKLQVVPRLLSSLLNLPLERTLSEISSTHETLRAKRRHFV